jgi:outer membrane lipoprotein-sorting protein
MQGHTNALELLQTSPQKWLTIRAAGKEWRADNWVQRAFQRNGPPGSTLSVRATRSLSTSDDYRPWRMWQRRSGQARGDFTGPNDSSHLVIVNGSHVWSATPRSGGQLSDRPGPYLPEVGPGGALVETTRLPTALDLDFARETSALGRRALELRGRPRFSPGPRQRRLLPFGWGATSYRLLVDAERGVLLKFEAFADQTPVQLLEMTEVAFDEPLPDQLFTFPST